MFYLKSDSSFKLPYKISQEILFCLFSDNRSIILNFCFVTNVSEDYFPNRFLQYSCFDLSRLWGDITTKVGSTYRDLELSFLEECNVTMFVSNVSWRKWGTLTTSRNSGPVLCRSLFVVQMWWLLIMLSYKYKIGIFCITFPLQSLIFSRVDVFLRVFRSKT